MGIETLIDLGRYNKLPRKKKKQVLKTKKIIEEAPECLEKWILQDFVEKFKLLESIKVMAEERNKLILDMLKKK